MPYSKYGFIGPSKQQRLLIAHPPWGSWVTSRAGRLSVAVLAFRIDVKVRQTDVGCELRYLPQATEEDHGAQSTHHFWKIKMEEAIHQHEASVRSQWHSSGPA